MPPERPDLPEQSGFHASKVDWSEEVAVDARGNIFMNDDKWGCSCCAIQVSSRSNAATPDQFRFRFGPISRSR